MINKLSFDLIQSIGTYLDIITIINISQTHSRLRKIMNLKTKRNKKAALIIINFFYKIKNNFKDLRLDRKGYLINYKKLYKHPELYLNKKIQFISTFQYYHNNLRPCEIGEGKLYYHSDTDSWFFNLVNNFYNYQADEPLPTHHLLYPAFIENRSFRVIKE
jgi:hypothetical protein